MRPVETVVARPVFLGGIGPVPSRPATSARTEAPRPAVRATHGFRVTAVRDVRAVPLDELSASSTGAQLHTVPRKSKIEAPPVAAFESAL